MNFLTTTSLILTFVFCVEALPFQKSGLGNSPIIQFFSPSSKLPTQNRYFHLGSKATEHISTKSANDFPDIPLDKRVKYVLPSKPNRVRTLSTNKLQSRDETDAYSWGYSWIDENGNQMFREEMSDGYGTVRGRYSFRDFNGIIRIVEYVADEYGYRTRIRSNEPGIVTSNPANAQIIRFNDERNIPL